VGGYAGAAVAKAGFAAIIAHGWVKTLVFIVVAPLMGLTLALLLTVALSWMLRRSLPRSVDKTFRVLQLVSAAAYSLGHGTNDAQKTMGIIVALLVSSQALFATFPIQAFHLTSAASIPVWVILSAHAAIGLGTMAGGWRIVRTMGQRITKLTPFGGFCAETSGAITLFVSSHFGIPVSTTHTITGAITAWASRIASRRCAGAWLGDRVGVDPDDPRGRGDRRAQLRAAAGHARRIGLHRFAVLSRMGRLVAVVDVMVMSPLAPTV